MSKFPCIGCGLCCRSIKMAAGVLNNGSDENLKFPYGWDDSGKCEMLQDDNTCKVYDERPLICNIEKFAEYLGLNKEEYYAKNIEACEKIMDNHNFPKEKRIWKKD